MQFKKELDFAMRILLTMAGEIKADNSSYKLFTVRELYKKTSIPQQAILRISKKLADAKFIFHCNENNHLCFYPSVDIYSKTMLDVIHAVEGNTDIYAAFDKENDIWMNSKSILREMEARIHECLNTMTIETMLQCK